MPVFISHSQEDRGIYSTLCLALDAAKVLRWNPSAMSPTESLAEQLRDAIRRCPVCVFVATRRSVASRWCLAEVGAFWGAGKKIFLFMGEPDLSDTELPPQFKGCLWTSDAHSLIDALAKETELTVPILVARPGNIFWLGHDLARAIRLAMFEPQNRDELDKQLTQVLHHLDEIGLSAPEAHGLLVAAIRSHRSNPELSDEERKKLIVNTVAQAKNELGDIITQLQPDFRAYASIAALERINLQVKGSE